MIGTDGGAAGSDASAAGALGLPVGGPTEQWTCDFPDASCQCGADLLLTDCVLDPSRPASPADCDGNTILTCIEGELLDGTEALFGCECMPPRGINEPCPCPTTINGVLPPAICTESSVCGCAVTCITR